MYNKLFLSSFIQQPYEQPNLFQNCKFSQNQIFQNTTFYQTNIQYSKTNSLHMDFAYKLSNSFNSQSISQNKQNWQDNFNEDVKHGKPFSNILNDPKDSRHLTLTERKPFSQSKKNKTTIGLQSQIHSQKVQNHSLKLSDIYVQNKIINNNDVQKQSSPKQPLRVIANQEKEQNRIKPQLKGLQKKIETKIQICKQKKQNVSKEKSQQKTIKCGKKQNNQVSSNSLKNQFEQSDLRLCISHKNQLSEATEHHSLSSSKFFTLFSHVMKPIKHKYTINHIFNRHQSCSFSQPVTFHLPTKNDQVLHSQKTNRFFNSQFKIFLNKRGQQFQLGTFKSNFTGSVYNFYPKDINEIHFSIIFSSKKTDSSNELRYCQIYINKDLYQQTSNQSKILPFHKMQSLQGLNILNSQQNKSLNSIIKLKSKLPTWSEQHQFYSLNFGTKSIFPSVKNTIIVDENEREVMKFYKNSHLTYDISFKNPLSWVLAYCFALASTDFKIATQ